MTHLFTFTPLSGHNHMFKMSIEQIVLSYTKNGDENGAVR